MDLQEETNEMREVLKDLNDRIKTLEGKGCKITVQVHDPFNTVNFVLVKLVTDY